MLRSGYSSDAVLREISQRHFVGPLNAEAETQLIHAGANQALVDALRDSANQASAAQLTSLQEKQAKQEEKTADAAVDADRTETTTGQPTQTKVPATSPPPDVIYRSLKGDLISFREGGFAHFDDEALEHKKLYLFFFSANGAPAGRKFTPELIAYYNRVMPEHPEFEIVFFSADRSQFGMETYMSQSNMPWPAVAYDKIGSKTRGIQPDLVRNIPCLVLVDGGGKVLSHSTGESPSDLEKVLAALDGIFAHGNAAVAQRH